jgi:TorA maturation chaperone TorD
MPKTSTNQEAESLANIFAYLAMLMRYPDSSFFDDEFLDSLQTLLASLHLKTEQQDIINWRTTVKDPLLDAQLEYTRLFINAVPHVIAPPYAAIYMDGDKTLQGKTTERTRDFYREHGFDLVSEAEPADHIQFELEFLSCLFREEAFDSADDFLTTLFRPWFERFLSKTLEEKGHPLYQVSVQLIDYFTKEEQ